MSKEFYVNNEIMEVSWEYPGKPNKLRFAWMEFRESCGYSNLFSIWDKDDFLYFVRQDECIKELLCLVTEEEHLRDKNAIEPEYSISMPGINSWRKRSKESTVQMSRYKNGKIAQVNFIKIPDLKELIKALIIYAELIQFKAGMKR